MRGESGWWRVSSSSPSSSLCGRATGWLQFGSRRLRYCRRLLPSVRSEGGEVSRSCCLPLHEAIEYVQVGLCGRGQCVISSIMVKKNLDWCYTTQQRQHRRRCSDERSPQEPRTHPRLPVIISPRTRCHHNREHGSAFLHTLQLRKFQRFAQLLLQT